MIPRGRPLVQIPVPPVRPLLRRTIKRFLRLLPSVLLLLFVVSLIFVTLMQIAVIHAHRRSLAFQRNSNSSVVISAASVASMNPSTAKSGGDSRSQNNANGINQKKRQEVLRIEALLDRGSLSLEANTKTLQNLVNAGRVKQILNYVKERGKQKKNYIKSPASSSKSLHYIDKSTFFPLSQALITVTGNESRGNDSFKIEAAFDKKATLKSNITSANYTFAANDSGINSTGLLLHKGMYLCPEVPPGLVGRVRIEVHPRTKSEQKAPELRLPKPQVLFGGHWEPLDCYSRHRVAIIIPYRDRREHLFLLLYHLHPILQRQLLEYKIYVIEQFGNDTFNKGVLMNAGVREALKENNYHCFVFHDVDLIPEDDRNLYSCPSVPRHMSVAIDKFNYSYLVGGVFSISKKHFILVNGYSNLYWGWGGEDDDMAH
ncbi:beta-1:4-N-acetylgalactosaminyltransferase bre-4-like protein, partial [Dinothrombium tinctorium]